MTCRSIFRSPHLLLLPPIFLGVAASALVACSDDTTGTTSTGSGGSTSSSVTAGDGSSSTASANSSGSTATSSSSSTGGGMLGRKTGFVGLASGASSANVLQGWEMQAGFADAPDASPGDCNKSTDGPCEILICATAPTTGTKTAKSAGVITATGGSMPVMITPDATNEYAKAQDSTANLWSGGETISIVAAGGDVPAFSTDLVAPSYIDVTSPAEPANGAPFALDRTNDLEFDWTGGGAGNFVVILSDTHAALTCTFPTSAGTGVVPASALAVLTPTTMGNFILGAASIETLTPGDWTIQASVLSSYTWNGVVNPQTFTYQATN